MPKPIFFKIIIRAGIFLAFLVGILPIPVVNGQTRDRWSSDSLLIETLLAQGKGVVAEKELLQLLAQYKTAGYKQLYNIYDLLAEVSKFEADLHNELMYRMEGIKSMEAVGDTTRDDYFYSKLALVYADLGMYDQSLSWITRSLQLLKKRHRPADFYGYLSLAIYDLITEKKAAAALLFLQRTVREIPPFNEAQRVDLDEMFGNCYTALGEYDKAERYYLAMMQGYKITNFNEVFYTTKTQMITDHIHYYETMSGFYILTGQYSKAGEYVQKILQLPPGTVRPVTLSKFHEMQFEIDSVSGNYLSAIRHLQLHKKINDSLYNANKSRQIAELQIRYETGRREQSIKMLEMQSKSQQVELQHANLQRDITIAGIAMLFIIAGLAYNGYRNKRRSHLVLQVKQAEINKQNLSLLHLVKEKEWLLKEVHHRIKNNLQIIISLLNAQTDFIDHPSTLYAITESRERMQAIALIHQKLYLQDHSTLIDMRSYIIEMVAYMESGITNREQIQFRLQLDLEPINLDVSQAVPLGLILNEAITNAVKYAFAPGRPGVITIFLHRLDSGELLLKIADNGGGLPCNFDLGANKSLGMQLMHLFADQLEGELRIHNGEGVEISLLFPPHLVLEPFP